MIVHGGGKPGEDRRAPRRSRPGAADRRECDGLPKAPVAVLWSTLPAGSPTVPQNRPKHFYPGDDYVDWVGTDFYSDNQDWKALTGLYNRFSDEALLAPRVRRLQRRRPRLHDQLMTWVRRHERCKMLIYYQDFGSTSPYRIQNYPASLAALSERHPPPGLPRLRAQPAGGAAAAPGRPRPDALTARTASTYPRLDVEVDAVRFRGALRSPFGATIAGATALCTCRAAGR